MNMSVENLLQKVLLSLILPLVFSVSARAESILVIGDSLSCGPYGAQLASGLAKLGNQVTLYCAVSSAPANWLLGKTPEGQECKTRVTPKTELRSCGGSGETPALSLLLKKHKGSRVIVALGTNSLGSPRAMKSYLDMASAIRANGNRCQWIGPPHLHPSQAAGGFSESDLRILEGNLDRFYSSLIKAVDPTCAVIDSRKATVAPTVGNETVDGVHRNESAGLEWARQSIRDLASKAPSNGAPGH
jgi:hypothetical protein